MREKMLNRRERIARVVRLQEGISRPLPTQDQALYCRGANPASESAFPELVWAPGEAQADFGDVDVVFRGERSRMHFFTLSFPFSNMGFCQLFAGETSECVCQGRFTWPAGRPMRCCTWPSKKQRNARSRGVAGFSEER